MSKPTWTLIAGCLALLLGACSGSGSPGTTSGEDLSKFDPVPGMELREGQLPITEADKTLIFTAESRLANSCMAKLGFPRTTQVERFAHPDPPPYLSPDELRRGGYQFDFAAEAASEVAVNGAAGPPPPTEGMSDAQIETYGLALNGSLTGPRVALPDREGEASTSKVGCAAKARTELYGSLLNYLRYDRAWQGTGMSALRKELAQQGGYAAPLKAWQDCMVGDGHDLAADIRDGIDYGVTALRRMVWVRAPRGEGPLPQAQIDSVVTSDADCQESSGLYEQREKLLPTARTAVVKKLGLESGELVAFQNAVLEKAKGVR